MIDEFWMDRFIYAVEFYENKKHGRHFSRTLILPVELSEEDVIKLIEETFGDVIVSYIDLYGEALEIKSDITEKSN